MKRFNSRIRDDQFAELNTDLEQDQAVFTVTTKTPHSYYAGEKYVSIEVFNNKGEKNLYEGNGRNKCNDCKRYSSTKRRI